MIRALLFASVLFATALFLYLQHSGEQADKSATQIAERLQPDFVARNIHAVRFDLDGQPAQQLEAEQARYFAHSERTELVKPDLLLFTDSSPNVWRATALTGEVHHTDQVTLQQQVVISAQTSENQADDTISTERIQINLRTDELYTELPITVTSDRYQLKGTGMHADLNTEVVEIKQDVHAIYKGEDAQP